MESTPDPHAKPVSSSSFSSSSSLPSSSSNTAMTSMAAEALLQGGLVILTGIILGAFGAHALSQSLEPKELQTFHTGVTYQIFHGFALLVVGFLFQLFPHLSQLLSPLKISKIFFQAGILFFSCNCYLYAVTKIKTFALLVPLGGMSFIIGWGLLCWGILLSKRQMRETP